jgi:hypothetical protein
LFALEIKDLHGKLEWVGPGHDWLHNGHPIANPYEQADLAAKKLKKYLRYEKARQIFDDVRAASSVWVQAVLVIVDSAADISNVASVADVKLCHLRDLPVYLTTCQSQFRHTSFKPQEIERISQVLGLKMGTTIPLPPVPSLPPVAASTPMPPLVCAPAPGQPAETRPPAPTPKEKPQGKSSVMRKPAPPIRCPKCHRNNSPKSKFCCQCGAQLPTAVTSARPSQSTALTPSQPEPSQPADTVPTQLVEQAPPATPSPQPPVLVQHAMPLPQPVVLAQLQPTPAQPVDTAPSQVAPTQPVAPLSPEPVPQAQPESPQPAAASPAQAAQPQPSAPTVPVALPQPVPSLPPPEPVETIPPVVTVAQKCAQCGAENKPTARFCARCGAALQPQPAPVTPPEPQPAPVAAPPPPAPQPEGPKSCPNCQAQNQPAARFCRACGTRLS